MATLPGSGYTSRPMQPEGTLSARPSVRGACSLCGETRTRPVFPDQLPWVVECATCGLRRADPQPSDEELSAIYDEHYYEQFGFVEGEHTADQGLARTKRATYASLLSSARPHFGLTKGKRLLDVGCGLGFSLLAARDAGFDAVGLDPLAPTDPAARPGRTIVRGSIETFHSETNPFDVVSMVDVIEHVRDPIATFRAVDRLLVPRGLLICATNDCSSRGAQLLGSRWVHYHRAHLFFFTADTLAKTAEAAGLEVLGVDVAHRIYNLEYVASILARGTNFELAARISRGLLRAPGPLLHAAWPALPEGIVLVARTKPR